MSFELLSGSSGLPLGLLSSKQGFTEVRYLLSPDFRFGLGGYPWRQRWYKRLVFGLFIVTSFLISILAGPSVAVLVIPSKQTDWPGGGALLWFWGNDDSLWPSRLTNAHIGPSYCQQPDVTALDSEALTTLNCIWSGFSSLAENFKQAHLVVPIHFNYQDGVLNRVFYLNQHDWGNFVYTIHLTVGIILKNAGQLWYDALINIPMSSQYSSLLNRERDATTGFAQSWLPAVRTSCNIFDPFSYKNSNSSGLQKVCSTSTATFLALRKDLQKAIYPFIPRYSSNNDQQLLVPADFFNSTRVGTQWVNVPQSALLSNGSVTSDVPSALLNVAIPGNTTNYKQIVLTCSIDARWAMGDYLGGPITLIPWQYVQSAVMQSPNLFDADTTGDPSNHDDPSWRPVQIDMDWLENLTPPLDNDITYTSLAAILTATNLVSLENSTNVKQFSHLVKSLVEIVVASLIADGMSRVGFAGIGQVGVQYSNPLNFLPKEPSESIWKDFMAGTYKFPRPATGSYTVLDWSVQVSGLAYHAESNVHTLALVVLFLHAALALAHIAYVLRTLVFCSTWESFTSLVVLAAKSDISDTSFLFRNAGSGIERYRTMKTELRIRTKQYPGTNNPASRAAGGTGQQVKLLFGPDEGRLAQAGFEKLEIGKVYG